MADLFYVPLILGQENAPPAAAPSAPAPAPAPGQPQTVEQAPNGGGTAPTGAPGPSGPLGGMGQVIFFIAIIAIFWFMMVGGQRKEKKRRAAMLAAIKKGDKVHTIGGQIGTVVEVRDTEVVLKIDENSNTRARFMRAAIQGVIESDQKTE